MKIAGYILSGGKNRRMGGEKKLFLSYNEKLFLNYLEDAMEDLDKIYLSVESKIPYSHTGYPLIRDDYKEIGPIGGIYSGLLHCTEEALLVVPCDTPGITKECVKELIKTYEEKNQVVVAESGERVHPLIGIYTKSCLPVIELMIEEQSYRMMDLLKRINYQTMKIENECIVRNINCREDYEGLRL